MPTSVESKYAAHRASYLGTSRLRAAAPAGRVIVGVPHLSRYEVTEGLTDFVVRALHDLP